MRFAWFWRLCDARTPCTVPPWEFQCILGLCSGFLPSYSSAALKQLPGFIKANRRRPTAMQFFTHIFLEKPQLSKNKFLLRKPTNSSDKAMQDLIFKLTNTCEISYRTPISTYQFSTEACQKPQRDRSDACASSHLCANMEMATHK